MKPRSQKRPKAKAPARACGLCGKTGKLTRTECRGQWICNVKLKDPPKFEPTRCKACGRVIHLGEEGYSIRSRDYYCEQCSAMPLPG